MQTTKNPHKGGQDALRMRHSTTSTTVPHGETLSAKSLPEISSGCLLYRWPGDKQPPIYGEAGAILSADTDDCEWGITKQSDDPTTLEGCSLMTAIGTLEGATGWHGVAWPAGQQKSMLFRVIDHIKGLLEPYGLSVAECIDKVKEIAKAKSGGAAPIPERPSRKEKQSAGENETSALSYRKLSDIRARPIEWTWYPYIPRRANTLITGDSDVGKSKAQAAIISTVTNGGRFPGTAIDLQPGNVIILSAEEDAETMLKPALLAAGANCDRVYLVESCAEFDSQGRMKRRLVTMERDIEALITLGIEIGDVSLTVIDPVTAYLGTKISGNDNTAIRSVMSGLQSFAENVGAANMLTTHFGKDNSRSAKLQVLGSVAFVAGVRSVLGVFRDPQDG